ncbi:hypothetical protein M885DRAFT_517988 [Pelagophyceae sp. CCMP2097]|nr:hypothetical protein M885DRAFT_517988 [Pelagophyceae sp. CCMP2097]
MRPQEAEDIHVHVGRRRSLETLDTAGSFTVGPRPRTDPSRGHTLGASARPAFFCIRDGPFRGPAMRSGRRKAPRKGPRQGSHRRPGRSLPRPLVDTPSKTPCGHPSKRPRQGSEERSLRA